MWILGGMIICERHNADVHEHIFLFQRKMHSYRVIPCQFKVILVQLNGTVCHSAGIVYKTAGFYFFEIASS